MKFEEDRLFEDRLSKILNPKHPLYKMSKAVPWADLEKALACYFPAKVGAPAKPIRLVIGLFMLQHCFDVSDEDALQNWIENPYWQFFCGYDYLQWELPIIPLVTQNWPLGV